MTRCSLVTLSMSLIDPRRRHRKSLHMQIVTRGRILLLERLDSDRIWKTCDVQASHIGAAFSHRRSGLVFCTSSVVVADFVQRRTSTQHSFAFVADSILASSLRSVYHCWLHTSFVPALSQSAPGIVTLLALFGGVAVLSPICHHWPCATLSPWHA